MKITFIGTSHGVPTKERFCSSAMIEAGNNIYIIDAGAPLADELARMGRAVTDVKHVFFTHSHSDHTVGVLQLMSLANWFYRDARITLHCPEKALAEVCTQWMIANNEAHGLREGLDCSVYEEGLVFEDEYISVSAIANKHLANGRSFGFLVTDLKSGKRILFTGDMSKKLSGEDFPRIALEEELDAVVSELAHFEMKHVKPYLEQCRAKAVYFNHVAPLSKLEEIRGINGAYPFSVVALEDGDEIVLE